MDAAELARQLADGHRVEFLFFWGHQPERDGSVGKGCLSQWWPSPFTVDGNTFATAEHYMMWRKALLFDDPAAAERVLAAGQPGEAKAAGREVRGFQHETWVRHRSEIVRTANLAKFGQHPELGRFLVRTGERVLVEASPLDPVWGIGITAEDPRANDPARWPGLNLLGFALGEVRSLLHRTPRTAESPDTPCRNT